jgi:hypothetical protein
VSRKGNGRDNAVAGSSVSSLKQQRSEKHIYEDRALAIAEAADGIETSYNRAWCTPEPSRGPSA